MSVGRRPMMPTAAGGAGGGPPIQRQKEVDVVKAPFGTFVCSFFEKYSMSFALSFMCFFFLLMFRVWVLGSVEALMHRYIKRFGTILAFMSLLRCSIHHR